MTENADAQNWMTLAQRISQLSAIQLVNGWSICGGASCIHRTAHTFFSCFWKITKSTKACTFCISPSLSLSSRLHQFFTHNPQSTPRNLQEPLLVFRTALPKKSPIHAYSSPPWKCPPINFPPMNSRDPNMLCNAATGFFATTAAIVIILIFSWLIYSACTSRRRNGKKQAEEESARVAGIVKHG